MPTLMLTVKSGGILTGEIIWQTSQGQKIRHSQPPRGRISLKETSSVSVMQVQETDTPVTTSEKHNESREQAILPPSENTERRSTLKKLFGALPVPRLQKMAESKAKEELENELYPLEFKVELI